MVQNFHYNIDCEFLHNSLSIRDSFCNPNNHSNRNRELLFYTNIHTDVNRNWFRIQFDIRNSYIDSLFH